MSPDLMLYCVVRPRDRWVLAYWVRGNYFCEMELWPEQVERMISDRALFDTYRKLAEAHLDRTRERELARSN